MRFSRISLHLVGKCNKNGPNITLVRFLDKFPDVYSALGASAS